MPDDLRATLRQRARAMRREMTPAERKLWYAIRNDQIDGFRFRRQQPAGPYIADFLCAALSLVVEVDGDSHADPKQIQKDAERTAYLREHGLHVVRFTNVEVMTNLDGVLVELRRCMAGRASREFGPSPPPSPRGTGKREGGVSSIHG
jgi:very-short-patch-repair endonuclease